MCDQVNGRLNQIAKFGPPKDMNQTFATIISAAPKIDIEELLQVRAQLCILLDEHFVKECMHNNSLINPVVAANIDFRKPEDGEVILRLCNLAKERNINFQPTHESAQAMHGYCIRKNIPPPAGFGPAQATYVPQPGPLVIDPPVNPDMPPAHYQGPPPSGGGYGGGGNYQQPVMPPQQPQYPMPQPMVPPQQPQYPMPQPPVVQPQYPQPQPPTVQPMPPAQPQPNLYPDMSAPNVAPPQFDPNAQGGPQKPID